MEILIASTNHLSHLGGAFPGKVLILRVSEPLEIAILAQQDQDLNCADGPRLCLKILLFPGQGIQTGLSKR